MKNWINEFDENNKMILSSRIRIARNLKGVPFPDKLDVDKGREIIKKVEDAFYTSAHTSENFKSNYLWNNDEIQNYSLIEKHLISPKLISNSQKSGFIMDKQETTNIMINEEDHIRIQCITSGANLEEAYDMADKVDNLLEEKIDFAFSEKLGYLTACPTNIGTGLRTSVMMHLPALIMNNQINDVMNALTQVGITIRGLYGEGSDAEGNMFQISNSLTLGLSEEDILNNLSAVVSQIINQENYSREKLYKTYKYELEDKMFRSVGILKSAVLLSSKESLKLLSNVRMGVEMGIINNVKLSDLNHLLIDIHPANLQLAVGKKLSDKERDIERAKLIREKLN